MSKNGFWIFFLSNLSNGIYVPPVALADIFWKEVLNFGVTTVQGVKKSIKLDWKKIPLIIT